MIPAVELPAFKALGRERALDDDPKWLGALLRPKSWDGFPFGDGLPGLEG